MENHPLTFKERPRNKPLASGCKKNWFKNEMRHRLRESIEHLSTKAVQVNNAITEGHTLYEGHK
jgi:hypothetical protein